MNLDTCFPLSRRSGSPDSRNRWPGGGRTEGQAPTAAQSSLRSQALAKRMSRHGGERDAEEPRDLRVAQPAEEMQLHDATPLRVVRGEPLERLVHPEKVLALLRRRA